MRAHSWGAHIEIVNPLVLSLLAHYSIIFKICLTSSSRIDHNYSSQLNKEIKSAANLATMSSEQSYDYSYEQFVQDDLPSLDLFDLPDLDLVGGSSMTSITDTSFYKSQEKCLTDSQQGTSEQNQQFKMISDTPGNVEFDAIATPQPSAPSTSTQLGPAATFKGAGELVLGVGSLRSLQDEFQAFDNTAGHSQLGGSERAQLSGIYGVPETNLATPNNMAQRASLAAPPIGPIDVSFFF